MWKIGIILICLGVLIIVGTMIYAVWLEYGIIPAMAIVGVMMTVIGIVIAQIEYFHLD